MTRTTRRLFLLALERRTLPSGVPATWTPRGSGGGGALFSPQFNPANVNEIAVASDMGQLFRSTDAGTSWRPVDFRQLQGGHESLVQYTEDANVRYSLTYSNDLVRPVRSLNAGQTWQPLANDPTGGEAVYFLVDPANHNRMAITDYGHLYVSLDGGQTWGLKRTAANSGAGVVLGGAFWDGTNIYFGTNDGLLTSTNGGTSFSVSSVGGIAAGSVIRSFAGAKQNGTVRFLAVTDESADVYATVPGYDNDGGTAVYTLTLGAANWTARTLPGGAWPYFAGMARADANTLYVAGGSSAGVPTVYKSADAGGTWASVFQTTSNANVQTGWSGQGGDRSWGYGELALGFAVDPGNASRLVFTDYGFAHSSTNGGATWQALYVSPSDRNPAGANVPAGKAYHDSGLDNTTSWQVAWANSTTMLIANSDIKGQRSTDGGQTWGFGYTGHSRNSMYRVAKASNGTLYAAVASVHDLYQSTYLTDSRIDGGNGAVLFSTDNGATWQTLHDFGRVVSWVAVDPTNPNRLYAAVAHSTDGGVYVTNTLSNGAGSTWTKLAAPAGTQGHAFNVVVLNDGTLVATYSGRRDASGAFTATSGLFVSTNGGASWLDRSDAGMRYWTKDVVIDPHDATQNTWYVGVFSGWGGAPNGLGGLYKTTNRGQTWTRVFNGDRVTSATFNPNDANELFVTTETDGLWYSNNIRAASPTFTQVGSYAFRQPERVFFNPYVANEIWVTSFGGGVVVGSTVAATTVAGVQAVQPTGATTSLTAAGQRSMISAVRVQFSGIVSGADVAGAYRLRLGGVDVPFAVTTATVGGQTVATLTPTTAFADGNYTLTVVASAVSGMSGDYTLAFHRLRGDADGDGAVDGNDLAILATTFNKVAGDVGYLAYLDLDGDGAIDGNDLAIFAQRFNTVV